jgi:hypothetical protein
MRGWALALSVLTAAGCQTVSGTGIELVKVTAPTKANVFMGAPSIAKVTPKSGLGNLQFKLKVKGAEPVDIDPAAGRYGLLALPDGAGGPAGNMAASVFTEAVVQLYSATASGTFDPTKHMKTLAKAAFTVAADIDGYYTATGTFGALRPAADYASAIFLRNNAGAVLAKRLGASSANTGVSIQAGSNNVDFTCTVNGNEASYNLSTSTNGNKVSDGGVVKGDTVTFNTGMANNQPGVARLEVQISGAAVYSFGGSNTAVIKNITDPTQFASFSWNTGATSAGAGETYNLNGLLAPATGVAGNVGQIDIVAYNANSQEVGRAAFTLTVFGQPTTTIRVQ